MNEISNDDVCYDILSLLQNNVCPVENVCNICGASHYTQNCPDYSIGEHVRDTPLQNMSRSSVPNGLHIIETDDGTCVVTSQKFAKGSRFGPLQAEKSFYPNNNTKFPLVIFGNPLFNIDDPELEDLFKEKNLYLDTTNEHSCNWMIHVPPAKYSNEQNLICFQLHNQIYYTAIQDIDVGDILKVWYAPKYAAKMNTKLLQSSSHEIVNNVLRQVSMGQLDSFVEDSLSQHIINSFDATTNHCSSSKEVSLPPINSLMRTPTLNFYHDYMNCNDNGISLLSSSHDLIDEDLNGLTLAGYAFDHPTTLYDGGSGLDMDDMNTDSLHKLSTTPSDEYLSESPLLMTPNGSKKKTKLADCKGIQNPRLKPAVYSCKLCNKTYVAICNLNKHHLQVHNLHLCNLCMKTFPTMEMLKDHVCPNQTFDSECSKCPICYKVLANPWSLARHIKCTHKGYTISVKKKEIILEEIDPTLNSLNDSTNHSAINELIDTKDNLNQSNDNLTIFDPFNDHQFNNDSSQSQCLSSGMNHGLNDNSNLQSIVLSNNNDMFTDSLSSSTENSNKMESTISDDDNMIINLPPLVQIQPPNKMFLTSEMLGAAPNHSTVQQSTIPNIHNNNNNSTSSGLVSNHLSPNTANGGNASPVKAAIQKALVTKLNKKIQKTKNNENTSSSHGDGTFGGATNLGDDATVVFTTKKIKEATIRTHKCDECGKMYAKKDGLQKHKLTHENRLYYCPFCSHAPVKSNDSLRRHFRLNHTDIQDKWSVKGFINSCIVNNYVPNENENNNNSCSITANDGLNNHNNNNSNDNSSSSIAVSNVKIKKNLKRLQNNNNNSSSNNNNNNSNSNDNNNFNNIIVPSTYSSMQQLLLANNNQICDLKCAKISNFNDNFISDSFNNSKNSSNINNNNDNSECNSPFNTSHHDHHQQQHHQQHNHHQNHHQQQHHHHHHNHHHHHHQQHHNNHHHDLENSLISSILLNPSGPVSGGGGGNNGDYMQTNFN